MGDILHDNTAVTCTPKSALSFGAGIVMGTVNTLMMKIMFETTSIGVDGHYAKFEKPMFLAFIMFFGMSFSLPLYYILQNYYTLPKDRDVYSRRVLYLLAIPSALDLFGSVLAQVGLLYVTPSLFMLIRCFVIIVTAILKVTVLGHSLKRYMWIGVGINFMAMCLVSAPTFLSPEHNTARDPRIGVFFIILSCFIQGSQYVFEEKVMTVDSAPALIVVGMEGTWGVLISIVICFPLFYVVPGGDKGSLENMWDAFVMLKNNSYLRAYLIIFLISVALYNIFAVYITKLLNSIWHAILDNFRPIAVWATDLVIFYTISHGSYGEAWVWPGSYIQFAGMLTLFFGTAVYNGSIPFIGPTEEELEEEEEHRPKGAITTPLTMASPMLMRSPLIHRHTPTQGRTNDKVRLNPTGFKKQSYGSTKEGV